MSARNGRAAARCSVEKQINHGFSSAPSRTRRHRDPALPVYEQQPCSHPCSGSACKAPRPLPPGSLGASGAPAPREGSPGAGPGLPPLHTGPSLRRPGPARPVCPSVRPSVGPQPRARSWRFSSGPLRAGAQGILSRCPRGAVGWARPRTAAGAGQSLRGFSEPPAVEGLVAQVLLETLDGRIVHLGVELVGQEMVLL